MIQEATKKVIENRNLTEEEAEQVMNEIMTGQAAEPNMAAFLTALRIKGETVEEISAFAKGMREAETKQMQTFCYLIPIKKIAMGEVGNAWSLLF